MKAFENYHPSALMVYFLAVLTVSMFVSNPVILAESLVVGALYSFVLKRRRGRGGIMRGVIFYLLLFLAVAVTNPLFSHSGQTALFFINGTPFTLEALLYGGSLAASVTCVLLWCGCYSAVMTSDKFLYLFGKAVPKLSLTLSASLRFIPLFLRQSRRVSRAQKAMGLYSGESFTDNVRSRLRVTEAMIGWSLENAMDTSASMKARGYGSGRMTTFSLFRFRLGDGILLAIALLLTATVIAGAAAGITDFAFYPKLGAIDYSPPAIAVYAAFGALAAMPVILEAKEALIWKYYVSKI